jgi:aspartate racemase
LRKIGLIGGMSWVSTRTYYEHINKLVQARTSTLSSAPLLIESLDFAPLARLSSAEEWAHAAQVLVRAPSGWSRPVRGDRHRRQFDAQGL